MSIQTWTEASPGALLDCTKAPPTLRHYTRTGAYVAFDENLNETLTPAKFADFAVLSEEILSTKVLLIFKGGRGIYRDKNFFVAFKLAGIYELTAHNL
jgi:predicted amidohydrolase YtcJ